MSTGGSNHIIFTRMTDAELEQVGEDPSLGNHTPHMEMIISNEVRPPVQPPDGNALMLVQVLLTPTSRVLIFTLI